MLKLTTSSLNAHGENHLISRSWPLMMVMGVRLSQTHLRGDEASATSLSSVRSSAREATAEMRREQQRQRCFLYRWPLSCA